PILLGPRKEPRAITLARWPDIEVRAIGMKGAELRISPLLSNIYKRRLAPMAYSLQPRPQTARDSPAGSARCWPSARLFTARQLVHGWGSLTVSTARPFSAAATG